MNLKSAYSFLLILITSITLAQHPTAFAGPDYTLCPDGSASAVLGASTVATGGTPPYTYLWSPATGLSSNTVANPTVTTNTPITYTLVVRDANDSLGTDIVKIFISNLMQYTAGKDTSYCLGKASNIVIGKSINSSASGATFTWTPSYGLNNPSSPNPIANPSVTTTYSLYVTKDGCTAYTGKATLNISMFNVNLAFHDTTINEGQTITLIANSSAPTYTWYPWNPTWKYGQTNKPDVSPINTTTFYCFAYDANGCLGFDTVRVNVNRDDDLVFYSAFTPNGDGNNDFFYIGNIEKYPDNILKIYNRYGQVVFTSAGYQNDWNGEYQGNKLPTGTYFYILTTNTDKGNYKGSVTILR
jgi:gliding motility-associated-like protein